MVDVRFLFRRFRFGSNAGGDGAGAAAAIEMAYLLDVRQRLAYQAFVSGASVRLSDDEAGHNLVGKDWYSAREH